MHTESSLYILPQGEGSGFIGPFELRKTGTGSATRVVTATEMG